MMLDRIDEIYDLLQASALAYPLKALVGEITTDQGSLKAESTLRGELNQQPGHKLGLITALQIMKKTGDLRALDKIEELFGRVAARIPVETHGRASLRPVMELNSNLIKEFSHEMKVLGNALKDGSVDAKESKACLKELTELIAACVRLKLYLLHSVGVRDYEPLYENKEVLHER